MLDRYYDQFEVGDRFVARFSEVFEREPVASGSAPGLHPERSLDAVAGSRCGG